MMNDLRVVNGRKKVEVRMEALYGRMAYDSSASQDAEIQILPA